MLSTTVYLLFMEVLLARNFRKDVGPCGSWFSTGSPTLSRVNLLGLAFKGVCTAQDTGRDSIVLRAKGRVPKPRLPLSHSAHSVPEGLAPCTLLGEVGCYLFLSREHLFCWYLLNCGSGPPDFVSSIEMLGATGFVDVVTLCFWSQGFLCRPGWLQTQCHPPASAPSDGILSVGH